MADDLAVASTSSATAPPHRVASTGSATVMSERRGGFDRLSHRDERTARWLRQAQPP
ncbi:hypothetical protein [Candidatus Viridilinea mediisalina]|uniref:hypothetical protein n=1 Tax=Candidatus Viridilinea mediisalina TaxID=2024553 RepID=UPI0013FD5C55|nr:hypothetical protein [Candidatus Viridilinea mediisalina]